MPIALPDDHTLSAQVLEFFRNRFPDKATGDSSFLAKFSRAVAMALLGLHKSVVLAVQSQPTIAGVSSDVEGTDVYSPVLWASHVFITQ